MLISRYLVSEMLAYPLLFLLIDFMDDVKNREITCYEKSTLEYIRKIKYYPDLLYGYMDSSIIVTGS